MSTDGSNSRAADLRDLAVALAGAAGELAVKERGEAIHGAGSKSSATDMVTAADTAAEHLIVEALTRERPHDAITGEEGTNRDGTSGIRWLIDPIDGTTNFFYGLPGWSVSIAAVDDTGVLAGAVFDPPADVMYDAVREGGARANGVTLAVREPTPLAHALVATGFGYSPERRRHQAAALQKVLGSIRDIRRFGSAAMDLCHLASGRVDGYFEQGLNDWDLAAGTLIAREAGATVDVLVEREPGPHFLLGATPELFEPLRDLLHQADALSGP